MKNILIGVIVFLCSGFVGAAGQINGAGATFPYPLYSKWIAEYEKTNPDVKINYQSIGSGGGIQQFLKKTVDFGASDAPMTSEQMGQADKPVIHIPTVLGAVVITYNLPEVSVPLKLTGEVIADIFLGSIKKWNDKSLAKLNPGIKLPDHEITVAHRSDGSGTSNIFTDYLSKVSKPWAEKVGAGSSVNWPVGIGGKGNEGVTGFVKQNTYSIGYTELVFALNNKLPVATIKNKSGNFIVPSTESVTAAAKDLKAIPDDFRTSITDSKEKQAYPISSFTYLLVYNEVSGENGKKILGFVKWAISEGQKFAQPLAYAPLPMALVKRVEAKVATITVK